MTFLFSHTRVFHARLHASSGKNTGSKGTKRGLSGQKGIEGIFWPCVFDPLLLFVDLKTLRNCWRHPVMALTPNAKRPLRLRVVLNVKGRDAISVATIWLNQIRFEVFKQARVTIYDENFLVILRTLFIWLRVRNVACNTLVLQLILKLDFATTSLLWSLRKRLVR